MVAKRRQRHGLVESIHHPLGFFVLALLIVETFLGSVLVLATLTDVQRGWGIAAGVLMFVAVVAVVAALTWCKPQNLTFDKDAHLAGAEEFGSNRKPSRTLADLPPPQTKPGSIGSLSPGGIP
jgi:hypothetical protein